MPTATTDNPTATVKYFIGAMRDSSQAGRKCSGGGVERILNCRTSHGVDRDWTLKDARLTGIVAEARNSVLLGRELRTVRDTDLRAPWWLVGDQGASGAAVAFACEAALRIHFVRERLLGPVRAARHLSVRHLRVAGVLRDSPCSRTPLVAETAPASIKATLDVARDVGCVPEASLPWDGRCYSATVNSFYVLASQLRIPGYLNLQMEPANWLDWLEEVGPVLMRLEVDDSFMALGEVGLLDSFRSYAGQGSHAICVVGFVSGRFVLRNSWGTSWGREGYAFASPRYLMSAAREAYGVLPRRIPTTERFDVCPASHARRTENADP